VVSGDPHAGALERAIELTQLHKDVYTALGVHPHEARLFDVGLEKRITDLIKQNPRVIAWGEIGLDYHYDHSPRDVQREVFRRQLQLAREMKLPIIIHTREAEDDTLEILHSEWSQSGLSGIMHCFSGSKMLAAEALNLGLLISLSGVITFKKADGLREVAQSIPLDRLLVETDCPYLSPEPFRGRRNEPARVVEVARCLANVCGVEVEEIANTTTQNFSRLFGLKTDN